MIDIDGPIDVSDELTEDSIKVDDDVGTEFEEVSFCKRKPVWVAACPPNQDLCLEPEVLLAQSLKRVVIQPLVIEIKNLIQMFGGVAKAFDMEWKIRLFVIAVLNFALIDKKQTRYDSNLAKLSGFHFRTLDNLVLDGEKFIEQFD